MRVLNVLLVFLISCSVANHNRTSITKYYKRGDQRIKRQEIIVNHDNKICKVNYASNGWQVLDSVSYGKKDNIVYSKYYLPKYNENNRIVVGYVFKEEKIDTVKFNPRGFEDRYLLLDEYFDEWNLLLRFRKELFNEEIGIHKFTFKPRIIPSIFTEYGVPFNEKIDSCNYLIDDRYKLTKDEFYFENFKIERSFAFVGSMLKSVTIILCDRNDKELHKIEVEYFVNENFQ